LLTRSTPREKREESRERESSPEKSLRRSGLSRIGGPILRLAESLAVAVNPCGYSGKRERPEGLSGRQTVLTQGIPSLGKKERKKEKLRGVLNLNRGFVELGAYAINRLRRKPLIEFYAWNAPAASEREANDPGKPGRDPLRLARYYQSLLDTGKFESRAALARFLGVSRANVTQVLNRLKFCAGINPTSHRSATEIAAG
jgi:hypothetical protein